MIDVLNVGVEIRYYWIGTPMRIDSENSEVEIARRHALRQVEQTLRELTANLIRVTRGAGKPYEIEAQAQSFLAALADYNETTGKFPSNYELANALTLERYVERIGRMPGWYRLERDAKREVICGSLQIAASRLLDQRTQERAGEHEMYLGIRDLGDIRAERQNKSAATKTRKKRVVGDGWAKLDNEWAKLVNDGDDPKT
jgi:hypothetical protein